MDTADRHETAVRRLPGDQSPNAVPPLCRAGRDLVRIGRLSGKDGRS